MKKLHTLLTYISSNRVWLITLVCLDLFFVFLAWVAYPGDFLNLVGLMIFVSFVALVIPFACAIHRRSKIDTAYRRFLLEPDDTNEYLLCESTPASMHTYIHELAHHLRTQLEYVNEQQLKITDYESYIENWVHEIKKPLSLMTLLLDNRKVEMSPLVHTRMLYVRDLSLIHIWTSSPIWPSCPLLGKSWMQSRGYRSSGTFSRQTFHRVFHLT